MLRILNTSQIKALDEYTIKHEPVGSIDLMERACHAFVSWFTLHFDVTKTVGVVCGTGNNGGDGLGIARLLMEWGFQIKVWVVRGSVPESADFKINLQRLKTEVIDIKTASDNLFADQHILIDAIFGSGLSRPPEGIYSDVIKSINRVNAIRIAIDIPSGLMADKPSTGEIVQAHHTITFQLPKLSFLLPKSGSFVGEWRIVNIGLDEKFIMQAETNYFLLEQSDMNAMLHERKKFSHKGNFGHALLIAGSYGKMGAAVLGARAAMRSGVGLLTVHIPKRCYEIIQTSVPEAMASVDKADDWFSSAPDTKNFVTVGIGPGIGQEKQSAQALKDLLVKVNKPVVIDADALNILGANKELQKLIPAGSILTPHPKEFERMVGSWTDDFERLQKQIDFSRRTKTVVLLKGANTSISTPEGKAYFNNTGNPGMATGGSGDVLTGLVTGLLAQGYTSVESALLGAWIHGLAGDRAAVNKGTETLIASDIIDHLPEAFALCR
ncbi:MAG TPA: NAD(P)H-hydrate dehydratase [Cyclobacteriaceae bacterium]|nr:NAD(P)H-hydrate dehydratase [Cyclobacteriaceae bacterium]